MTTQPSAQSITYGDNATFSAAASGDPTPTVQWQASTDAGATWNNLSGETSTTLFARQAPGVAERQPLPGGLHEHLRRNADGDEQRGDADRCAEGGHGHRGRTEQDVR